MRTQGFVLMELLIYSSLLVVVAVITMSYAATCSVRLTQYAHTCTSYAHMSVAWDFLMRDLYQAPMHKKFWKLRTETACIWTTPAGDIGWEHGVKGIVRSQGIYDMQKQCWRERTQSLVASGLVVSFGQGSETEHAIQSIEAKIEMPGGESLGCSIALRAGVFL